MEYDYIIGIDYDETQPKGSQWGHGLYFEKTVEGLTSALETFRIRTEENYITRSKLEELATQMKIWLMSLIIWMKAKSNFSD